MHSLKLLWSNAPLACVFKMLQATRLDLTLLKSTLSMLQFFLDWQKKLSEGTVCLNTTLVLKVHCTFPETSKIKCSTSLRLHPITGKRARACLHDFDPASYIFWVGAPNASMLGLKCDLRIFCNPDCPRRCCNFSLIGNFFKWRQLMPQHCTCAENALCISWNF